MTTVTLGRLRIDIVTDGYIDIDLSEAFPALTGDAFAEYPESLAAGRLRCHLTTYVVRDGRHTLLVDTGIGPRLGPQWTGEAGTLLDNLQAIGVTPESVDAVLATHLHVDHIGWNCVLQDGSWRPTFPHARYAINRAEWAAWEPDTARYLDRQVRPLLAQDYADLVDDGYEPIPGVRILDTPGHTAGHISVLVFDGGEGGVITGDAAHTPLELVRPELSPLFDDDPVRSADSRRALVERIEADGLTVMAGHFPPPHAGKILRVEQRRVYRPVS